MPRNEKRTKINAKLVFSTNGLLIKDFEIHLLFLGEQYFHSVVLPPKV